MKLSAIMLLALGQYMAEYFKFYQVAPKFALTANY